MGGKKAANINQNWMGAFLQYFTQHNKRIPMPKRSAIYSCGSFRRGVTPGAFGNPKPFRSLDPRITNNMRVKILKALKDKVVIDEA